MSPVRTISIPTRQWAWLALCWPLLAWSAPPLAPEFTHSDKAAWLNSPPLNLSDLRGRPVLIEFWTFGCTACRRSIPWVQSVQRQFGDRLIVIGVHTPEFSYERGREAVARKLKDFEIRHPVMLDDDFSYWNALGNRHWPAFYLLDAEGRILEVYAGEVTPGSKQAMKLEARLTAMTAKIPPG